MTSSRAAPALAAASRRSEEHTSELQSQSNLVCRLLLEKKKPPRPPRDAQCAPIAPAAQHPAGAAVPPSRRPGLGLHAALTRVRSYLQPTDLARTVAAGP